jgi:hypothetical protein
MSTTAVNFRSIRPWDGSQHRAFEELCYQLLREPQDLPAGNPQPIRTGNPDGGVEWYVELADGTQWGWQAKYYFVDSFDSLLNAMAESVRRVAVERPGLRRLNFCIPFNLSTGTADASGRNDKGTKAVSRNGSVGFRAPARSTFGWCKRAIYLTDSLYRPTLDGGSFGLTRQSLASNG